MNEEPNRTRAEFLEDYKNKTGKVTGKKYQLIKPITIGYLVYEPGNAGQSPKAPWTRYDTNMVAQDTHWLKSYAVSAANMNASDAAADAREAMACNLANTLLDSPATHLLGDRELLRRVFQLPDAPAFITELAKRYEMALNELEIRLNELKVAVEELERLHLDTLEGETHGDKTPKITAGKVAGRKTARNTARIPQKKAKTEKAATGNSSVPATQKTCGRKKTAQAQPTVTQRISEKLKIKKES